MAPIWVITTSGAAYLIKGVFKLDSNVDDKPAIMGILTDRLAKEIYTSADEVMRDRAFNKILDSIRDPRHPTIDLNNLD